MADDNLELSELADEGPPEAGASAVPAAFARLAWCPRCVTPTFGTLLMS